EFSTLVSLSEAVARTISSVSRTIEVKSAVASDWKTIAALPREVISRPVSKVTYAVLMANSRSSAGWASLRLPVRMSRKPTPARRSAGRALQLGLVAGQRLQAGLDRRVGREQRGDRRLDLGREDVEGGQLARRRPQVALRDLVHLVRDLDQRRGQRARAAGDDRRAAVGGELAVARERLQQQVGDHVDDPRDDHDEEEAGAV